MGRRTKKFEKPCSREGRGGQQPLEDLEHLTVNSNFK